MRFCLVIPLLAIAGGATFDDNSRLGTKAENSSFVFEHLPQMSEPPITIQPGGGIPLPIPRPTPITPGQFIERSGLIFSGTVMKVEHTIAMRKAGESITQITFRVNDAVRGVHPGEVIRVREWGGLWNAGERYQIGETLFLFLYPPSKLGLTSPVGGAAGKFMVRDGRVLLRPQHVFFKPGSTESSISVKDFVVGLQRIERE